MGPWGLCLRKGVLLTAYFQSRLAFHAFEEDSIGKLKINVQKFCGFEWYSPMFTKLVLEGCELYAYLIVCRMLDMKRLSCLVGNYQRF